MKSYNHLYECLISDENIEAAIIEAASGNMKRYKLKKMKENPSKYIEYVRECIINYEPHDHTPKIINDGIYEKKREIIVPTIEEHLVHHAVMRLLKQIFMKGMYEHSYASIPDRGCFAGMKTMKKWIWRNERHIKYCLKLDIRKFFDSISQGILIDMLKHKIHDSKFMNLLEEIIHTTDHGLPLGFYTSQWFANFYLQKLDHFIKEDLRIKYYMRYMDDMVLFMSNKRELHKIKYILLKYINNTLNLEFKNNWQIFRFHTNSDKGRFLDFMGFRFYRNRVTLRRKITRRAIRKANRISRKKKPTVYDARQMISYIGWTKPTDTYSWLHKYILTKISFRKLRKLISTTDRGCKYVYNRI